ncbi:SAM-dependent methyltransferase [Streptomyces sp. TRM68416]|uniref:SAM-dependent methyltransferase n=1 Tax=Streptomyces sp. TRM68416 TaxID=2758412 RepID=UPI0016619B20|nr:class I SAM-dependent methyltransferase [Streptomyces sp. TRM68416]MBD0844321.1 methyltransferase domain-containing protein [Streptomyces sp. TRM68416]
MPPMHRSPASAIHVIDSPRPDPYRAKVEYTYDDPPWMWERALGPDNLLFQFGLFSEEELTAGPSPGSVGPSEVRHFERQLEIAGLTGPARPRLHRILDLGCGWGFISRHLAERFPEAVRIDAVNISMRQLEYCAEKLHGGDIAYRIRLYLCDGQDVDLLPEPEIPYDLVVVRGVYTHFLNDVFETSVKAVSKRLRPGGLLIVSDTLYKTDLTAYRPALPDTVDRLACGNRKSPAYFARVLEEHELPLVDMRITPSNAEIIHWFGRVRLNIERHFPDGVSGPIEELREMAVSFSAALAKDEASVYSIISRRAV